MTGDTFAIFMLVLVDTAVLIAIAMAMWLQIMSRQQSDDAPQDIHSGDTGPGGW